MHIYKPNPKLQVLLFLAVWLAMCAGDWFMRFYWFGWQRNWFRPEVPDTASMDSVVAGTTQTATVYTSNVPGAIGGDLTRLIGIPAVIQHFEQKRGAYVSVTDSEGFYSPYCATQYCPVVVVGDSFMVQGQGWTNTFAGQLAERLKVPVRNRGIAGKGAVMPLVEYLDSRQFKESPPEYLVYGLLEREMTQRMLAGGMVFELWQNENIEPEPVRKASGRIRWGELRPAVLKWQLPNTSVMAKLGADAWNLTRFYVFRQVNPDVVVSSECSNQSNAMLFYREAIDLMKLDSQQRGIEQVVWALEYLNNYLARNKVRLVLVLVPDKAQVYRAWLPENFLRNHQLPPSCLWEVEEQLLATNVAFVNLLHSFREEAQKGKLLYWRDDTHWNHEGIRLATELTAQKIKELQINNVVELKHAK